MNDMHGNILQDWDRAKRCSDDQILQFISAHPGVCPGTLRRLFHAGSKRASRQGGFDMKSTGTHVSGFGYFF